MSLSFTPKLAKSDAVHKETTSSLTRGLQRSLWWFTIMYGAVLPVLFLWGVAPLGFMKSVGAYFFVGIIVIGTAFLALRITTARVYLSWVWWLLVGMVLTSLVSAYVSGDIQDALFGSTLEVGTVAFLALFTVSTLIPLLLQGAKQYVLWFLMASSAGLLVVLAHVLVRVFGSSTWLSFGVFPADATITLVGSFNDAGLLAGVLLLFSSIALLRFPLSKLVTIILTLVALMSLLVLLVVNMWVVWALLAYYSAPVFLYLLSRDTLFRDATEKLSSAPTWLVSLQIVLFGIIASVCIAGVVAGPAIGQMVERATGVSYVEVRPSVAATVAVGRAVYQESGMLFGAGPNQFGDVWRLYKNPAINQTIFWDTTFQSGSSFVATLFITIGLLGGLLFIAFQAGLLYIWYQLLIRAGSGDQFWYSVGLLSASGAGFLGVLLHLYAPGPVVLLWFALLSGLSLAAYAGMFPERRRAVAIVANRRLGFIVLAVVIVVCAGSIGTLYTIGTQYVAYTGATAGQQTTTTLEAFEEVMVRSFARYPDHRYLLPVIDAYTNQLAALLATPEPTEATRSDFLRQAERGIVLVEEVLRRDPTDVAVQVRAAQVYQLLSVAGIAEAGARANSAITAARDLDPQSPLLDLLQARYELRASTTSAARPYVIAALTKKSNFTEALTLLAQIDIAEGNTEAAIAATQAMITIEPQNPTRYFQLGVLRAATGDRAAAMAAYEAAIARDTNYANARYMLALMLLEDGAVDAALAQLEVVVSLNQDNATVAELVAAIKNGSYESAVREAVVADPVLDARPVETEEGVVTTAESIETDLVVPVNAGGGRNETEQVSTETTTPIATTTSAS